MRGIVQLLLLLFMGLGAAWGQVAGALLARHVQLVPGQRPLGRVLAELSSQSGIPISYSSSRVPTGRLCRLWPGPARPVGEVLRETLAAVHLSYGLLDGQLVLWPTREAVPPGVANINGLGEHSGPVTASPSWPGTPQLTLRPGLAAASGAGKPAPRAPAMPNDRRRISARLAGPAPHGRLAPNGRVAGKRPGSPAPDTSRRPFSTSSETRWLPRGNAPLPKRSSVSGQTAPRSALANGMRIPPPTAHRGRAAGLVEQHISLARLGSREISLQPDTTTLAGPPALVGRVPVPAAARPAPAPAPTAFQLSVVPTFKSNGAGAPLAVNCYSLNLLVGHAAGVRAAEVGGLANVVRDTVHGVQVAGLLNATGTVRGGVQLAGVANLNRGEVRGVQVSALLNVARRDVRGLQVGLVNVARRVHGVQLGLLNLADSVDGVSVGLLSLVRHGYLHGEVWASESLPLNAVAKVGSRPFYTLLGVAAEPFGNRVEWASGAGFGSATRPRGRVSFSLDLMQWFLAGGDEEGLGQRFFTQLRPAVVWQIEKAGRLQLVAGPSLNLAVARRAGGRDRWTFGENQWLWLDTVNDRNIIRLWPGVQLGLRF